MTRWGQAFDCGRFYNKLRSTQALLIWRKILTFLKAKIPTRQHLEKSLTSIDPMGTEGLAFKEEENGKKCNASALEAFAH